MQISPGPYMDIHIDTHTYMHTFGQLKTIHICIHHHVHTYTNTCTHIYSYVYTYVHTYFKGYTYYHTSVNSVMRLHSSQLINFSVQSFLFLYFHWVSLLQSHIIWFTVSSLSFSRSLSLSLYIYIYPHIVNSTFSLEFYLFYFLHNNSQLYIIIIHNNVTYWPSAELSNKKCTCVNSRYIRSKISGYNLDCGRVELGADMTPTRSRWMSNNYITWCDRQVQLVGVRIGDKML